MTLAYPLTLNHCQSLRTLGSLGNRNRSSIASPPICLALTREVHAVFMPVWDGFKLFSYQKAHSDILFERHRKPQISQPPFNHMSWFKRPESDLLPRRAVTAKEWDVIYHPEPHTRLITRAPAFVRICAHTCMWGYTHTNSPPLHPSTSHKYPKKQINTCSQAHSSSGSITSICFHTKAAISQRSCLAPRSLAVRSWITCFLQTATTSPSTQGSSVNAPF